MKLINEMKAVIEMMSADIGLYDKDDVISERNTFVRAFAKSGGTSYNERNAFEGELRKFDKLIKEMEQ